MGEKQQDLISRIPAYNESSYNYFIVHLPLLLHSKLLENKKQKH